jgi:hypothetical protein
MPFVPEIELPGLGRAVKCEASTYHSPTPLRFVWHHVQPHEAGGLTVAANLVQLCDSCHYSVHRLMWQLAQGQAPQAAPRRAQLLLATKGYTLALNAGTVDKIPNEG